MIMLKNSVTSEIIKDNNLQILSNINESFYKSHNKSKSSIHSQIDPVLPNLVKDIKLPKDKLDILLSLDNEMGKSKQKSIVPRKGVHSSIEDIQVFRNSTNHKENTTINTLVEFKNRQENIYNLKNATSSGVGKLTSVGLMPNDIEKNISHTTNKTEVPKKPLILSNEGLDKMTLIESDQNYVKENRITKVPKNPNSHPGMIMPIVITMLFVPVFAVVAYLAVKRGQEAWKNRHYKRMDFLLDGMYND